MPQHPPAPGHPGAHETSLRAFEARIGRGWWVVRGPNGGIIAALLVRALERAVDDPGRPLRSLTVHFTSAPTEGSVEIVCRTERSGGTLTTASARMTQGDRLVALALAGFVRPRAGLDFADARMPAAPAPADSEPVPAGIAPPYFDHYEARLAIGAPPLAGADRALTGGWMRLRDPGPLDAAYAAALLDAWPPAVFARRREVVAVPTADLTIHLRAPLPPHGAALDAFYLCRFESRLARDGAIEEDGELWSSGGTLLAQSRQLALLVGD